MSQVGDVVFLGVDLGWYGRPSGLASIGISREDLHLRNLSRLEDSDEILPWIQMEAGDGSAATVNLFNLPRIVKYKRGRRASREKELRRLRRLMLSRLPLLHPAFALHSPAIPNTGKLKPVEDQIDAVLCSYIAAHWWFWGIRRNRVYGCGDTGYVVVPERKSSINTPSERL
jgi:predicted RNase H-like nuclease